MRLTIGGVVGKGVKGGVVGERKLRVGDGVKGRAKGEHIHTLKIFRFGKSGKYLNAAPCPICSHAIKLYGIKHVEHT